MWFDYIQQLYYYELISSLLYIFPDTLSYISVRNRLLLAYKLQTIIFQYISNQNNTIYIFIVRLHEWWDLGIRKYKYIILYGLDQWLVALSYLSIEINPILKREKE